MRALRRVVVALLLGVAVLLVGAASASGHAILRSTDPADGEVVAEAPDELALSFNEDVSVPTGGLRLFDRDGERVPLGQVVATGATVSADLSEDLPDGTYIVTWRATSADSHPLKGAFVFTIGAAGPVDGSLLSDLFAGDRDRGVAVLATLSRGLNYAATLFVAGVAAFLVLATRRAFEDRHRLSRLLRLGGWMAIGLALVAVPLQSALETGLGVSVLTNASALGDAVGSWYGASILVRVVALVALLLLARSRLGVAALVVAVVAALSFVLEGHTLTTDPQWVVVIADVVHLMAGAVWFGGLVALAIVLRQRGPESDPVVSAGLLKRFSDLATGSLVGVVAAGVALAWVEVRALRALTSTTYGRVLIVKLAVAALVIALGAYNNRRLVPSIAAVVGDQVAVPAGGSGDAGHRDATHAAGWRTLRRTVRLEVAGLALVLLVTGVLVNLQPAAEAAGIGGAFSVYEPVGQGYEVNLVVDPNRAGTNQIHLYLLDATGRPVGDAEGVTLMLRLPIRDIGPIERTPPSAGPGHWVLTGNELSIAGAWEIVLRVHLGPEGDLAATIPVVVNP
ncbi:MAG: copper resistance protein CopC [Actinobacteria bacterium]|nr:copper resistance protein CopC [Actinomycetota bacterium]